MKTLLLTHRDLHELVTHVGVDTLMGQLVERMSLALAAFDANRTDIPVRTGFHYDTPSSGLLEWMPLMDRGERVLMKIVGYHPDNGDTHGVPTILSTLNLFDPATGHLLAIMDGTLLTAMRTGAASAVASGFLASPESRTLGLVGCGAQAVTQLHALLQMFDLSRVVLHDADPSATASFRARVSGFFDSALPIDVAPVERVVGEADILCVATSIAVGAGPVFAPCETKPWLHVNAVGSDFPGKIEVPVELLRQCLVAPDSLAQARVEGECQQLRPEEIGPTLVELAKHPEEFTASRGQRTLFDSTGWALEDYVAMSLALEHASALRLGTEVEIEIVAGDPRDPYEFLERAAPDEPIAPGERASSPTDS